MKKYLTLTILTVFLLATFSIYYIQSALAKDDKLQFYIEQTGGDKEIIKDISVSGAYNIGGRYNSRYQTMTIKDDETSYVTDLPYFKQMDYEDLSFRSKQFQKLKKDYPSFMRGKYDTGSLFEDDNHVIYAEVDYSTSIRGERKSYHFTIDRLNKQNEKASSYKIDVPKQKNINIMEVYDVQYHYNEMRIITANQQSNPYVTEVHQYSIDLKKEKVTNDEVIFTHKDTQENYHSTYSLMERNATQPSSIMMFETEESPISDDDEAEPQPSNKSIYVFQYKKGKLSELKLPDELQNQPNSDVSYLYDEDYLYANLTLYEEQQTTATVYKIDWKTGKVVDKLKLNLRDNKQIEYITLRDDHIQLFGRDSESHPIFSIYNLDDGKLKFEGRIEAKDKDAVNFKELDMSLDSIGGI
ncbi:hypothetical protein AC622_06020 [Bacillus sp. FJAT-27916]|uniref:hypothetical protein n=1 Tax=Bacillaceae TaxID=186817 RepID=UPI0006716372|nr:hypothetical protein [Bacillus sp. FJAT-27916]KMY43860.1 hypothetical protein AC622_06020 [Bacillus sp. FJAT-27916]